MGKLERMKQEYDNIVIPKELSVQIEKEIEKSRKREAEKVGCSQTLNEKSDPHHRSGCRRMYHFHRRIKYQ